MRREVAELWSPELGWSPRVIVHGHHGRPVLVFPSSQGQADDYENNGMVGALQPLLEAGRLKLFLLDSWDSGSWYRHDLPLEERAQLAEAYERWVTQGVVPLVDADCGGRQDMIVTGCSFGAFHAVNIALRRPDLFPMAIGLSGVYDAGVLGWGEQGMSVYLNNPMASVGGLEGAHLQYLRHQLSLLLVCGQGEWEDSTGSLNSTKEFGALCLSKGLRVEVDLWGHDVPHDWPSWRAQIAHHLPRFV
ncbi:MAG TPA: alpha/beta hydrolase-fold protein [Mycobacteriales bacterium]|nr:alpha/beta hydrolase-fold protein [Mycobacteriales bacterium]